MAKRKREGRRGGIVDFAAAPHALERTMYHGTTGGSVLGGLGKKIEHCVSAMDDRFDLLGIEAAEFAVGFRQHDHTSHAVLQATLPTFFSDLRQRNRGGVSNGLADKPTIDLLVRRQCRRVSQEDVQEAKMLDVPA
jgi:hypothetical protein